MCTFACVSAIFSYMYVSGVCPWYSSLVVRACSLYNRGYHRCLTRGGKYRGICFFPLRAPPLLRCLRERMVRRMHAYSVLTSGSAFSSPRIKLVV